MDRRRFLVGGGAALAARYAAAQTASQPTRITYWCWSEHARGAKAVLPRFRELNPDIDVDIVNLNPQEIQDKILIAMATRVGAPDVSLIIEARFPTYPPTGGLLDVTNALQAFEPQYDARIWQRLRYRDRLYGFPYIQNTAVMFYRRDLFEQAGITAPIDTWPEWVEAGHRIRAKDPAVFMHQVSPGVAGNGALTGYMESAGVQYFDASGKTVRNNRHAAEVLRFYHDLARGEGGRGDGIAMLVAHNSPELFVALKDGKLAALHSGNWGLDRLETECAADKGKWAVQPWPRWSKDAPPAVGTWGGSILTVPKSSRNQAAAVKWALFLATDPGAQVGLWRNGYGYPTNHRAQQDPRMLEPQPFLSQSMYEASLKGREVRYFNLVPDWPRVQVEMGRQMDLMFQGAKAPEQAWADFEAAMVKQYG